MRGDARANFSRKLYGAEDAPMLLLHALLILLKLLAHFAGVSIQINVAFFSTAAFVKGKTPGEAAYQAAS